VLSDGALTGTNLTAGIYSTVIGSNLGAFLTPLGALAGIMWASMLNRAGVSFSFKKYTLYGVILVIPSLAAALFGLYLRLAI
ncbi:MAG: arsenical efflux pump membrane protein ArsB, partial [Clostridia bacterium]|nr:arsenical efflux pump membrane protein ArsB [Clostridia bacterium]